MRVSAAPPSDAIVASSTCPAGGDLLIGMRERVQDNDWQSSRVVTCPNCGVANPAGSGYCSSCGSQLPRAELVDEETVIDVSSGQPRVLDEEQPTGSRFPGGFTTVRVSGGRVVVTEGSRRNCLIVAVVGVLLVCCVCWVFWSIPDVLL
jgi:hypothetical protein